MPIYSNIIDTTGGVRPKETHVPKHGVETKLCQCRFKVSGKALPLKTLRTMVANMFQLFEYNLPWFRSAKANPLQHVPK